MDLEFDFPHLEAKNRHRMRNIFAILMLFSLLSSNICCGEFNLLGSGGQFSAVTDLDHSSPDQASQSSEGRHCEIHCSHVTLVETPESGAIEIIPETVPVISFSFIYENPYVELFKRPPVLA